MVTTPRVARQSRWRAITLVGFAAAGALFVTSAHNARGMDLRAASVTDLDTVVRHEKSRADALQAQVQSLNADIARLGRLVNDRDVARLQAKVDRLKAPAGFRAASGPGVTVVLDDTPKEERQQFIAAGSVTADMLVVHQQDIQAVVNALWAGGATAISVQDQRIISTTGVKCVGNTVVLHGVPYSPPYRIKAIGDPVTLQTSIDNSSYIDAYQTYVSNYDLGWDESLSGSLDVPAYAGTTDLRYAVPAPVGSTSEESR